MLISTALIPLLVVLGAEPKPPPAVDPDAMAALEKMGAFLRKQTTMKVESMIETDDVLDDGQKVTLTTKVELIAHRPNRLKVVMESDRKNRQLFFDGKQLTLVSPRLGFYATAPMSGTLADLARVADEKYDIDLPLTDLFAWGTDQSAIKEITSAFNVGPARVGGVDCDQFAFRQEGLDWQIWIEKGAQPLPRKLMLTTTSDQARPVHSVTYSWTLGPVGDDSQFTFVPGKDVHKIDLIERSAQKPVN